MLEGWSRDPSRVLTPNFHKVHEALYRGAQPERGGVRQLAQLGIKTIVDLRRTGLRTRREEEEAGVMGLRYFNVPFSRLTRPTDAQVARVMSIIDASEMQPVFVHCRHGLDRTGMIIAIHRLQRHGWTHEEAMAEARSHGMSRMGFALRSYVARYHREKAGQDGSPTFARFPLAD